VKHDEVVGLELRLEQVNFKGVEVRVFDLNRKLH